MKQQFVIVGANLAGGRAAEALRTEGFDGHITLIGAEPHLPYERPPLSKEFLQYADTPSSSPFLQTEAYYAELQIELRIGTRVTHLSPQERTIEIETGERLVADKVLLCTGGRVRRLNVPGVELDGVHYLRTLEDAIAIRKYLVPGRAVVVIGGGFIGAEVTASARISGCEVTLLEVEDILLWRALGREMGAFYTQVHRAKGVKVQTSTGVERIGGTDHVQYVVTTQGQVIDADLVVIGVGIEPAIELAHDAGITVGNGIMVDEYCQTSVSGIYAAGDVANHPNALLGKRVRLEHWRNAQNQALAAARAMLDTYEPFTEVPWFWSDQYDLKMQMAGHPLSTDQVIFRGNPDSLNFSAFYLRDSMIAGAVSVNRPRELRTAMKLIERHAVVDKHVLMDEQSALQGLLKEH